MDHSGKITEEVAEEVTETTAPSNLTRRTLLIGLLSAYSASLIPWALAQPVANPEQGSFVAVSAILVGRQALDAVQAKRLYDALTADDSGFPAAAQALLTLINDRKIDPVALQKTLDDEHSPLAALPRKIMTAWCLGIVGDSEKARCIAYETALNAVIVEDVLKPPTYAYGTYGSWAKKPL
ncbi:sorbitol dehydrogenase family protein [Glaciimonas soli]|uniref:D-sorbitol dehydrogenase-like protein n=1 Tax=Glaciimonas soli TaxID=2590999 RepID=A0A843YTV7_9BURK|nr:sorbitol dehydrogenase family protein [Glaciimonas soli]MQR00771.1 hypothetical protein [Glaciimonas soli]